MSRQKPTLSEVAEKAGVSRGAVSLALRDHPKAQSFNPATVRKIKQAARDLGYRTSFFSSQLRRGATQEAAQLIMIYLDTLQDLYSSAIAEIIQLQAAKRGYWTMITVVPEKQTPMFDEQLIGDHGVSAVALISSVVDHTDLSELRNLIDDNVNLVTVGRERPCEGIFEVTVADYHGGWLAAEHVYQSLGARRVCLMGKQNFSSTGRRNRHHAVTDYAQQHNFPPPEMLDMSSIGDNVETMSVASKLEEMAYVKFKQYLCQAEQPPEAVITGMDLRALGVYRALYEHGLQPGRDVAVVGYDDIWPAGMIHPTLTTVHQPTEEMGRVAVDLLLDRVEGKIRHARSISLEPELIIRDSTRNWQPQRD